MVQTQTLKFRPPQKVLKYCQSKILVNGIRSSICWYYSSLVKLEEQFTTAMNVRASVTTIIITAKPQVLAGVTTKPKTEVQVRVSGATKPTKLH